MEVRSRCGVQGLRDRWTLLVSEHRHGKDLTWTMWRCWHTWRDVFRQIEQTYKLRDETLGCSLMEAVYVQLHGCSGALNIQQRHTVASRCLVDVQAACSCDGHFGSEFRNTSWMSCACCVLRVEPTGHVSLQRLGAVEEDQWSHVGSAGWITEEHDGKNAAAGHLAAGCRLCVDSLTDWTCVRYVIHLFTSWGNTVIALYWSGNTFWEKELF